MGLIDKGGLDGFEATHPKHLSEWMRQRVALVRTLAIDPETLFLDKPLSALDLQTKLKIEEELVRIPHEEGKTLLLITHDLAEAVSVSDKVLVVSARAGLIKAEHRLSLSKSHSPEEASRNPEFNAVFEMLWQELRNDVEI